MLVSGMVIWQPEWKAKKASCENLGPAPGNSMEHVLLRSVQKQETTRSQQMWTTYFFPLKLQTESFFFTNLSGPKQAYWLDNNELATSNFSKQDPTVNRCIQRSRTSQSYCPSAFAYWTGRVGVVCWRNIIYEKVYYFSVLELYSPNIQYYRYLKVAIIFQGLTVPFPKNTFTRWDLLKKIIE